jgi:hypothetical protein
VGVLAAWRYPGSSRRTALAMVVAVGLAAAVHIAGSPPVAARVIVAALVLAMLAASLRGDARRWAASWLAATLLLFLSTPAQLPGLVGVLAIVAAVSTTVPRVLVMTLVIVAGRLLLLRLLEGELSYSAIEWHVARLGGAPTKLVGHVLIAAKFALAVPVLALLVGGSRTQLAHALGWSLAAILFAMAHATTSLVVTAGQYHTPYVDLSTLLYLAAIAGTLALAWLVSHKSGSRRHEA